LAGRRGLFEPGDAVGDVDAFVVLGEAALVPFAVCLVVEHAEEGGEGGRFDLARAGEVESALHDEFDPGLIVRNGLSIQKGEKIRHGDFVFENVVEGLFLEDAPVIAVDLVVGDFELPLGFELLHGLAIAKVFDPFVEDLPFVGGQAVEFGDGLELGVHFG